MRGQGQRGVSIGWWAALGAAGLLGLAPAAAEQGPLPEAGECEFEIGQARDRGEDRAVEQVRSLRLGCGLDRRNELELSLQRLQDADGAVRQLAAEGRFMLTASQPETMHPWQWALTYGVSLAEASGSAWRAVEHRVAVQGGIAPAEHWWLEVEVGTERDLRVGRDSTPWSLTAEVEADDDVAWQLELSGTDKARPDLGLQATFALVPDRVELKLGARVRVGRPSERGLALGLVFPF